MPSGVSITPGVSATGSGILALAIGGIPIGIPSSGSFAANGALSGLTVFDITYANCYLYFPANAIGAGVAAGLYFTQMSSTSAGTVYNNLYVSGIPLIPFPLVPFVIAGPGAYTQTVSTPRTLTSVTVPGNAMGVNGSLIIDGMLSYPSNANAKNITCQWAGNQVYAANVNNSTRSIVFDRVISNRGSQGSQVTVGAISSGTGSVNSAVQQFSVDSSQPQAISITGDIAVATDWLMLEWERIVAVN